jgi:hypothetical protein
VYRFPDLRGHPDPPGRKAYRGLRVDPQDRLGLLAPTAPFPDLLARLDPLAPLDLPEPPDLPAQRGLLERPDRLGPPQRFRRRARH